MNSLIAKTQIAKTQIAKTQIAKTLIVKTQISGALLLAGISCCGAQAPAAKTPAKPASRTPAAQPVAAQPVASQPVASQPASAPAAAVPAPSAKLAFALPQHPGSLSFDQGKWDIKETSARPDGTALDLLAEDLDLRLKVSFFAWPQHANLTAETCREERLKLDGPATLAAARDRSTYKSRSGADVALVLLIPEQIGSLTSVRAFVAAGDLCGDILFSSPGLATPRMAAEMFDSIQFDPQAKPSFQGAFAYAKIEDDHKDNASAARDYQVALGAVDSSDDPVKWRRVATDEVSNSLGLAGDLKQVRAVNQAAIASDPLYPIYYYSLACADAEDNDTASVRTHLHQAFERRPYVLPGETMPDPATDESFRKLMADASFATFLKTLNTIPVIKPPSPPKSAPATKPAPATRPRTKPKS